MSSNTKEISTKEQKIAEGTKESSFSTKSIMEEVKTAQKSLPNFLDYNKKYRAEKVANKSGFKLNDENKAIMGGK